MSQVINSAELDEMIKVTRAWAGAEPLVTHVWLFGSRVKGGHKSNADLDIAYIAQDDAGNLSPSSINAFKAPSWKKELESQLNVEVDLVSVIDGDESV